jgi:hypothetical protein
LLHLLTTFQLSATQFPEEPLLLCGGDEIRDGNG